MTVRPIVLRRARSGRQQGLSLVEVLVAMTIGLLLLGGVGYMFMGTKQMNTAQTDVVRMQESTRNALDVLGSALRQAGYRLNVDLPFSTPLRPGLGGINDTSGGPDVLIVRHDPNWVVSPAPAGGGVANPMAGSERNCEGALIASNNAPDPTNASQGVVNGALITYQFRVVNRRLMCYANDAIPPAGAGVVVADNVEDMQVQYGIGNGTESVLLYTDTPTQIQFAQATAVRVNLLLRGPSKGVTVGAQTVRFNGMDVTTNDGYLRKAVTATFGIRNQARF